ncbi:hypothetical protein UPYG_G00249800 [Umbra pygmaea]|uniref:Uncharacterized protein n=1 Tax=Umbra pygmaea TaxID=75934 RepID=A0ABD0WBP8_UMBPY
METVLQVLSHLLPLPYLPEDQPRTLTEHLPTPPSCSAQAGLGASSKMRHRLPVENKELGGYSEVNHLSAPPAGPSVGGPCECSQSEVTYLSSWQQCQNLSQHEPGGRAALGANDAGQKLQSGDSVDLYGSWPVQCGCSAEGDWLGCDDCRANGFSPGLEDLPQGDPGFSSLSIVDNPAKERLRKKIDLYNRGYISTEELVSTSTQE